MRRLVFGLAAGLLALVAVGTARADCFSRSGHWDYRPGHFDLHRGHIDYHPGQWDFHRGTHLRDYGTWNAPGYGGYAAPSRAFYGPGSFVPGGCRY